MNYADSFRKAQERYDNMEPPCDPPWLEEAVDEAEDAIRYDSDALLEAMNDPFDGLLLRSRVSNAIAAILDGEADTIDLRELYDAVHNSAVARALEKAHE